MSLRRLLMFAGGGGSFSLMGSLNWINVKDYGAVGDNSHDDTTAFDAAIAQFNANGRGVLYCPAPPVAYAITAGLTPITASGIVLGDGSSSEVGGTGSLINLDSTTATVFTPQGGYTKFEGLAIKNVASGTVTAGAAIVAGSAAPAQRTIYEDLYINNFYDSIDSQAGAYWTMRDCVIRNSWRYGVRVRNVTVPDQGDWLIDHCSVLNDGGHSTDAAFRLESSGAARIQNCEVLGALGYNHYGIDIAATGATSILLVQGNSFESYGNDAVRVVGDWPMQVYIGNEFGQYGNSTGHAFNLSGCDSITIDLNHFTTDSTPTKCIVSSSVTNLTIGPSNNVLGPWTLT